MAIHDSDNQLPSIKVGQVQTVKCESCEFTEECTPEYIAKVRDWYCGRWICGLCSEAVKHELMRSSDNQLITIEEALHRHITFCKEFRSSTPNSSSSESDQPISAIVKILSRSLDSPRTVGPKSSSMLPGVDKVRCASLLRSESCFSG
uniref:Uncharacterized protein n=1 Tax=Kalanchoe fedtschenkoi TaxID=63787 RepID=A0A7N0UM47_KALFE